jgi:thioredoxin reductase (NADPH)
MILMVHRRGEFTGEVGQLTGAPCLLSGIAQGDCEVYELSSGDLWTVRAPDEKTLS